MHPCLTDYREIVASTIFHRRETRPSTFPYLVTGDDLQISLDLSLPLFLSCFLSLPLSAEMHTVDTRFEKRKKKSIDVLSNGKLTGAPPNPDKGQRAITSR